MEIFWGFPHQHFCRSASACIYIYTLNRIYTLKILHGCQQTEKRIVSSTDQAPPPCRKVQDNGQGVLEVSDSAEYPAPAAAPLSTQLSCSACSGLGPLLPLLQAGRHMCQQQQKKNKERRLFCDVLKITCGVASLSDFARGSD